MFERFTDEARAVVVGAQDRARRLGHSYVAPEHLLLAAVAADAPASAVFRQHGLTPERVESEIRRRIERGRSPVSEGLFSGLDREALSAIGIDLDAVQAAIQSTFSAATLLRAETAVDASRQPRRMPHLQIARRLSPRLRAERRRLRLARWPRRRPRREPLAGGLADAMRAEAIRAEAARADAARAAKSFAAPPGTASIGIGQLPLTPRGKRLLLHANRESLSRSDGYIGVEHIALALVDTKGGLAPEIVFTLGGPAPLLRTAILDRYRKAG